MKPCDRNIFHAIQLSQEMIRLADQGDAEREDSGCGILYGVLRDAAYKIWRLAEEEKKRHKAKGQWRLNGMGPGTGMNDSHRQEKPTIHDQNQKGRRK